MWLRAASLLAVLVMLSASCAFGRRADTPAPAQEPVTIEVRNNNWADVNVYAVRSSQRVRLGTVTAAQTRKLTVHPDMIGPGGEIRIFAQAIGGYARYLSPRVYVGPGDVVALELEVDLRRSTISTW
jgi:hypothetical protein